MGIRLSIDDFGTGYSSLEYLKKMPLDMLKIAQSFVRDITIDTNDAAIVKTIVQVAQSLYLEVIAEGVETVEHLKILNTLQCDKIQGDLFSRPLPAEEIEEFLGKEWRFLDNRLDREEQDQLI
jgi:EAL domain-containing protein (putative c-di-GMP-specific phosphodiesterase class I)